MLLIYLLGLNPLKFGCISPVRVCVCVECRATFDSVDEKLKILKRIDAITMIRSRLSSNTTGGVHVVVGVSSKRHSARTVLILCEMCDMCGCECIYQRTITNSTFSSNNNDGVDEAKCERRKVYFLRNGHKPGLSPPSRFFSHPAHMKLNYGQFACSVLCVRVRVFSIDHRPVLHNHTVHVAQVLDSHLN